MVPATQDRVAPFFWDNYRDTTMGVYQSGREMAFIWRCLRQGPRPRRLLDLACGSGRVSLPLHAGGISVVGIDLDPVALAAFRNQAGTVALVQGSGPELPFASACFDWVLAMQCFEYFDHRRFLGEAYRVLRPGGLLIFDALNRRSYKGSLKTLTGRTLGLPSAALTCREILTAAGRQGFAITAVQGYNWPPFNRLSDSRMVGVAARVEQTLHLERLYRISPKILVAARRTAGP